MHTEAPAAWYEQFTLNFEMPEKNKGGFMCLRPQSIVVNEERVDGFLIYMNVSDPRLLLNPENLQAKMLEDKSGVVIKERSLPYWFTEDIDLMKTVEQKNTTGVCTQTFEEHQMRVAEYKQDKNRHYQYTVIKFPRGMKGSNVYFNDGIGRQSGTKNNVVTKTRFMKQSYDDKKGVKFDFISAAGFKSRKYHVSDRYSGIWTHKL
jgi:hypothetical protein